MLAGSLYLIATHLPLRADFAYLLPDDAPAVRDMRRLEARVKANDTVLVVIRAPDGDTRATATADLAARIRALPPGLVARVDEDDAEARTFLKAPPTDHASRLCADRRERASRGHRQVQDVDHRAVDVDRGPRCCTAGRSCERTRSA